MSEKGYRSLVGFLYNFNPELIDCIVFARDRNVIKDYSEEIESLATENGIRVYERTDKYHICSKYVIAISWRWLIPISKENTLITLHDSLLPKYRGFSPLVNQLINKEPYIGVSAIVSNAEYDKGDIIAQLKTEVSYPIRIKDAISKVSILYVDILKNVIQQAIENNSLKTIVQNEEEATYSLWRDEVDYKIDWNLSASEIQNFIFSVGFPYKGSSTFLTDKKIRIYDAMEVDDVLIENRDVGKVIFMDNSFPVVVCGKGLLNITDDVFDDNADSIFPLKNFRLRFL